METEERRISQSNCFVPLLQCAGGAFVGDRGRLVEEAGLVLGEDAGVVCGYGAFDEFLWVGRRQVSVNELEFNKNRARRSEVAKKARIRNKGRTDNHRELVIICADPMWVHMCAHHANPAGGAKMSRISAPTPRTARHTCTTRNAQTQLTSSNASFSSTFFSDFFIELTTHHTHTSSFHPSTKWVIQVQGTFTHLLVRSGPDNTTPGTCSQSDHPEFGIIGRVSWRVKKTIGRGKVWDALFDKAPYTIPIYSPVRSTLPTS
jgi:hypothetical protein